MVWLPFSSSPSAKISSTKYPSLYLYLNTTRSFFHIFNLCLNQDQQYKIEAASPCSKALLDLFFCQVHYLQDVRYQDLAIKDSCILRVAQTGPAQRKQYFSDEVSVQPCHMLQVCSGYWSSFLCSLWGKAKSYSNPWMLPKKRRGLPTSPSWIKVELRA